MSTPIPETENEFTFTVKVRSFGNPAKVGESAARAVLLGLSRTVPGCEVSDEEGTILALGPKNFTVERFPKKPAKKARKSSKASAKRPTRRHAD